MDCSLRSHVQGYRLSCVETLQMPLISTYGLRHLALASSQNMSQAQRWGHRIIAAIQLIPLVGLLASLVERVAMVAYSCLQQERQPRVIESSNSFDTLSSDVLGNISGFLDFRETALFARAYIMDNSDCLWRGQVRAKKFVTPKGTKPAEMAHKIMDAESLVEFCRFVNDDYGFAFIHLLNALIKDLPLLEKANRLRKWIKDNIKKIGTTILDIRIRNNNLKRIPPEIKYFNNLMQLSADGNQFSSLPKEIGDLTKLEILWVNRNKLVSLPPEIGKLSRLRDLRLSNNPLTSVPAELGDLPPTAKIQIHSCPMLTSLPPEVAAHPGLSLR